MSPEKEGNRQESEERDREGREGKAAEWSFYLLLFHFDRKLKAMNKNAKWSTMQKENSNKLEESKNRQQ